MKPRDYHPNAGRTVKLSDGSYAFVPTPMPPRIEYDAALVLTLSKADTALSELAGLARQLPDPRLIVGPYVRREAVLSSRIEGTQADLSDVLMDEVQSVPEKTDKLPKDVLEVRNYVSAVEQGIERMKSLPLSLRLVRELHRMLMVNVDNDRARGGEFRKSQNWIGPPGSTIATATYVPPPPNEMKAALNDWEKFIHTRDTMPDLIQCALLHEQFEAIHPFIDGNGRIGRILITLFLIERGRLSHPVLYLSEYIEANRSEYYERLQRVRTHGDWNGWLLYFLTGVAETAQRGAELARELVELREKLRKKFISKPRVLQLIDRLFENPYISAANVSEYLGVTAPTSRALIALLEKERVLKEVTQRSWGRMWVAVDIATATSKTG